MDPVAAAIILNSERETTLMLLHDHARWLQTSVRSLYADMADPGAAKHADADKVIMHAAMMNRYIARLLTQNEAMERLHSLATREWPKEIKVTVLFDPKQGLRKW
jgi:hypothetical protein